MNVPGKELEGEGSICRPLEIDQESPTPKKSSFPLPVVLSNVVYMIMNSPKPPNLKLKSTRRIIAILGTPKAFELAFELLTLVIDRELIFSQR